MSAQNFGIGASLRVTFSQRMACRKACTVKVYESLLIVRSVINHGALSQLGMLVEENGRSLSPFSYLLPVIARVLLQEQPVTVSTTGIKSDTVKHLLGKKDQTKAIKEAFEVRLVILQSDVLRETSCVV